MTDNLTLSECRADVYIDSSTGGSNQQEQGGGTAEEQHDRTTEMMTKIYLPCFETMKK